MFFILVSLVYYCRAVMSDCGQNCTGRGRCTDQALCHCQDGFTGTFCENSLTCDTDTRDCNNGICIPADVGFKCVCEPGYEGVVCDEDINECDLSRNCSGNGQCDNLVAAFKCNCIHSYRGTYCEQVKLEVTVTGYVGALVLNDPLDLSCDTDYTGRSLLSFTWTRITDHAPKQTHNLGTAQREPMMMHFLPKLEISNVEEKDSGNYTCTVTVEETSFNRTVYVEVLSPAQGPDTKTQSETENIVAGVIGGMFMLSAAAVVYKAMTHLKNKRMRLHPPAPSQFSRVGSHSTHKEPILVEEATTRY